MLDSRYVRTELCDVWWKGVVSLLPHEGWGAGFKEREDKSVHADKRGGEGEGVGGDGSAFLIINP
jgi:hypothetical protein